MRVVGHPRGIFRPKVFPIAYEGDDEGGAPLKAFTSSCATVIEHTL
jgi:hypothetical protein